MVRYCRQVTILTVPLLLLLCVWFMLPATADVTLGPSARSVAMGGAGLASGDAPEAAVNPAFLADTGARFGIRWPSIDAHMQGANLGDVFDLLRRPSLNVNDALDLATTLGDSPVEIDAAVATGLLLPKADLTVNANIRTEIAPNAVFQQWVRDGADPAEISHVVSGHVGGYPRGRCYPPAHTGPRVPSAGR